LNDSRFPSVFPWVGFTSRWFVDLWNDDRMLHAARNTVLIALAVVAVSIPIGTAAAILINGLQGRSRSFLYGVMVAPILTPGAVIGISTLLFWNRFDVPAGLHLSTLGQCSFISAYVMLLVLARLQTFDPALEEAALDLGATSPQVMRRIMIPHLYPAIGAGALIAFFQSVENFKHHAFHQGQFRHADGLCRIEGALGHHADHHALALILIVFTVVGAVTYEILRRRADARERALAEQKDADDSIMSVDPIMARRHRRRSEAPRR